MAISNLPMKLVKKLLIVPLALLLVGQALANPQSEINWSKLSTATIIKRTIEPYMLRHNIPGIAVAVYDRGKTTYANFGVANVETQQAISKNTLFQIASVTKVFTATLLALAINQGKLALHDKVGQTAPFLQANKNAPINQITILELATHTSGLPSYPPQSATLSVWDYTSKDLYAFFDRWQPSFPPGTQYQYSDIGYGLLGDIIANAYQSSYYNLVARNILKPLGMNSTVIIVPESAQGNLARSYNRANRPAPYRFQRAWLGAGALYSSAYDLIQFVKANLGAVAVPQALASAMKLTHKPFFQIRPRYFQDLGWTTSHWPQFIALFKTGDIGGFNTYIGMITQQKLGVVVLANKRIKGQFERVSNTLLSRLARANIGQ